jgi:hypothetical protein
VRKRKIRRRGEEKGRKKLRKGKKRTMIVKRRGKEGNEKERKKGRKKLRK